MNASGLRARLLTALRDLDPEEQGTILLMALAIPEAAPMAIPGAQIGPRTRAGVKHKLAGLVRAALRGEQTSDGDYLAIHEMVKRLRAAGE